MNLFDWMLIGVAVFCVLRGMMRGAVSQLLGIAGILAGFYLATNNYQQVGGQLRYYFHSLSVPASETIAFALLFLLTWFCISAVGFWIGVIMRRAGLGFLDRIWGAMIGFAKAVLIGIAAVSILTLFGVHDNPLLTESKLMPYLNEASTTLLKMAPEKVQIEFRKNLELLERFMSEKMKLPVEPKSEKPKADNDKNSKGAKPPSQSTPDKSKPDGEKSEKGRKQPLAEN